MASSYTKAGSTAAINSEISPATLSSPANPAMTIKAARSADNSAGVSTDISAGISADISAGISAGNSAVTSQISQSGPGASGLDAPALRATLERLAAAAGIRQWDLGAACSSDTSVQVDRGEAKQMKGAQRSSITLRVWNADGLVGITSTSDLSESGLERALGGAKEAALYADYVEAGQMPAVLANRFGGVIFHEACGHLLETTQVERGTTPFAEQVGELIAHEAVTAIDEGHTDGAFGSLCMDDEGLESQRTVLIENGILKRFLSDRAGELRTGHPRTGSGRRQGHSFAAASRMRNTYIAAGPHSPEQLIASVDRGLYCKAMGGGSVGPTGQFNFAVEEGYLIEDGQLTKPVKGATLIGAAKEVMPRISMCANDLELAAGFCGSVSGSIFVTVGQPHIKVDSITVGGR